MTTFVCGVELVSVTMADLKRFQRMNLDDESLTSDLDERHTLQLEEFGSGAWPFGQFKQRFPGINRAIY